jgi:hypothetical protein
MASIVTLASPSLIDLVADARAVDRQSCEPKTDHARVGITPLATARKNSKNSKKIRSATCRE